MLTENRMIKTLTSTSIKSTNILGNMGKYKKYLYDDGKKIPRCTILKRKRRALEPCLNPRNRTRFQVPVLDEPQNPEPTNKESEAGNHKDSPDQEIAVYVDDLTRDVQIPSDSDAESSCNKSPNTAQDPSDMSSSSFNGSNEGDVSECSFHMDNDPNDRYPMTNQCNMHPDVEVGNNICPCARVSVDDIVMMVLSLGIRHILSWVAQVDFLSVINTVYGDDKLPKSKYLYLKQIENRDSKVNYYIFCPNDTCERYLGDVKAFEGNIVHCDNCNHSFDKRKVESIFVTLSLEDQLKNILKVKKVVESLFSHRFDREKHRLHNIEDIYDGECYKALLENGGPLSNPHNFSYSFNTDGMPIGKPSRKILWPIYVTINELPHCDRDKYVLLAGLYIGNKDPDQNMYLELFVEQANQLSSTGFTWDFEGLIITSLFLPLCAVVDSVARFRMLNMSSYTAYYGCTFCYICNERTRKGIRFTVGKMAGCDLRTQESTIDDVTEAFKRRHETKENNNTFCG